MKVLCVLLSPRSESRQSAFAEALLRLSPRVAIRVGEPAVFLEPVESSGLLSRVRVLAQRVGGVEIASVGWGAHPGEALARTRFKKESLPIEALLDFASPFRNDPDLSQRMMGWLATLRMLGIRNLEEFKSIPTRTLASRLGEESVVLSRGLQEGSQWVWPRFTPDETIIETTDLVWEPCLRVDAVLFVLKEILDRVMARLRGRSLRLTRARVRLRLDGIADERVHEFEYASPQGSTLGALPLMRERLFRAGERGELGAPVIWVSLEVLETAPGRGAQRHFFDQSEEQAEAWEDLIGRLNEKLGSGKSFVAIAQDRFLPEKAWKPLGGKELQFLAIANSDPMRVESDWVPRPARILDRPERLYRVGPWLVFVRASKRWKVIHWDGPERISGEWWSDPYDRDYYRVMVESGEQLWIFQSGSHAANKDPEKSEFFLHGYFD